MASCGKQGREMHGFRVKSVSVRGPQRRTLVPNRAKYNTLCFY